MPSSLKKLGSHFFLYLLAFVLLFSFAILLVLGIETKRIKDNISDSFQEFSNYVNEESKDIVNENDNAFIKNYVDIEANAFTYILNQLKSDLQYLSDSLTLKYESYDNDKDYYLDIANDYMDKNKQNSFFKDDNKVKVFFHVGVDKNDDEVKKELGILCDLEDNLLLTIKDALQERNCLIMTENGVAIIASNYDFKKSLHYSGNELDYKNDEWYKKTIATDSIIFDNAYNDALSHQDVISVEKSFKVNGVTKGAIAIDIYIDSFSDSNLESPDGVNIFISDENSNIIYNTKESLFDEEIAKEGTIYQFLDDTKLSQTGNGSYIYNGNEYRCFYKKIKDTNYTLYVSIRENRLKESINKLQTLINTKNDTLIDVVSLAFRDMYIYVLVFASLIIIIQFILAKRISKTLEVPIKEMSEVLKQASIIQKDMLPHEFSNISKRKDIEIYAENMPETEVGGDFYNYIIKNNKLFLIIADVSGSGMPAALFMAKTNTLLNNAIKLSESSRVILSYVNAELCKKNKECYFVTIALYCIDLKTKKVVYTNSGHEDSIIIKENNDVELIKEVRSAPMGLDEHNNYSEQEFYLEDGDVLFLYTDGVVEAINKNNELFGIERLINELKLIGPIDTKSIVQNIERKITDFSVGVEQYDDITMLCFKYKKIDVDNSKILINERKFNAVYESVDKVDEFIKESLETAYVDNKIYNNIISQLEVCIEEIVVNICDYVYDKSNNSENSFIARVEIDMNIDRLSISFIDSGKEFDPTKMREVNILKGVDQRNIGGFGIHITKNIVDTYEYERKDNKNVLTITKYL